MRDSLRFFFIYKMICRRVETRTIMQTYLLSGLSDVILEFRFRGLIEFFRQRWRLSKIFADQLIKSLQTGKHGWFDDYNKHNVTRNGAYCVHHTPSPIPTLIGGERNDYLLCSYFTFSSVYFEYIRISSSTQSCFYYRPVLRVCV